MSKLSETDNQGTGKQQSESELDEEQRSKNSRRGLFTKFLDFVEWTGNKLPDPIVIFFALCVLTILASGIAALLGWSAVHPGEGETIEAKSLLTIDGLRFVIGESLNNFAQFPALGQVLVIMLGIGVAERSGWFEILLSRSMQKAPKVLVIPVIALVGLLGNIAGDAAPIVLPPLAALVFLKLGWHPLAGIALAYASAVGGFAANLMIGMSDALVQGFTQPAAEMIDSDITTNVAMNWYFIAASVGVLLPTIWLVTSKLTVPRLGSFNEEFSNSEETTEFSLKDARASKWANISVLVFIAIVAVLVLPENSFLRNGETGSFIEDSPFMNAIGFLLAIMFFIPGLVYALVSGRAKGPSDITKMMVDAMATMGSFIVIIFFAAQMLAYVSYSNMGAILAIKGAELLQNQDGMVLIIGIILLSAFVNLFVGSASAKWALLAPIFVPMMMLLNYHPAFTQMIYRIGDAVTNPITPMFPYFALVLTYAQKYQKDMKIGTFISTLVPYSLAMGIVWTVMIIIWYLLGWPVGPGGPIYLEG